MKKLAVGLTSAPFGGPPADTATSAKTDIEDEEVSNKTGFGQFETNLPLTIDFSKLKEVDMNSEIKKLEAALSGIGYNIKFASMDASTLEPPEGIQLGTLKENLASESAVGKKFWIWFKLKEVPQGQQYNCIPCIEIELITPFKKQMPIVGNDQEAVVNIIEIENINLVKYINIFDNIEYLKIKEGAVLKEDINGISDKPFDGKLADYTPAISSADQVNGASTNPGTTSNNSGTPKASNRTVQIAHTPGTILEDNNWSYLINSPTSVTVTRLSDKQKFTLTPKYSNWNKFSTTLNKMSPSSSPSPAPASPSQPSQSSQPSQPSQPASTPNQQSQPQTATSGEVTELLNGKKVVTVGASGLSGGDIIMLEVDSINTGDPKFYIKDGKTGNVAALGPNDGRVRGAISRADSRRLAASLAQQGVAPNKVDAFLELMKLERRQNRIPFGRKKRQQNMDEQRRQMQNKTDDHVTEKSARDLRISRLEKKGIL